MKPLRRRGLTPGEIGLARSVFGEAIRLKTVRILSAPWPFDRAFVAGCWFGRDWIVWPAMAFQADFSAGPLSRQGQASLCRPVWTRDGKTAYLRPFRLDTDPARSDGPEARS